MDLIITEEPSWKKALDRWKRLPSWDQGAAMDTLS
jgi:hypothetical protein